MSKIVVFISEIIPFFFILVFILYPSSFISVSTTILGKVIALAIIAFYTSQDLLSGVLVGLIILCYYQTDMIANIYKAENFEILPLPMMVADTGMKLATENEIAENEIAENEIAENFANYTSDLETVDPPILPFDSDNRNTAKPTYLNGNTHIAIQRESETVFKNQSCSKDLEFIYENQIIRHPETIQMLFKDLVFLDDKPCNPCDPTCSFSTSRISFPSPPLVLEKTELIGKNTKGGNSALEEVMVWAQSWMVTKLEPFFGVGGGNVASYL